MEVVYIIVAICLAIVGADILSRKFSHVPAIFFEITIGIGLSYMPLFYEKSVDPEILMLILVKPLIFSEAQRLSMEDIKKCFWPVVSLSFVLAALNILVIGVIVKIFFPQIPIVLALILMAMIIPTNTTILKSITKNLAFPKHTFHILEGESLLNESIAILIFDLALKAFTVKEVHFPELAMEFVVSLAGGLVVGIVVGFTIIFFRGYLMKHNYEAPAMLVMIQLITPFIAYIVAEKWFHVSGILAIIVTGMIHGVEKPLLHSKSTKLQVISDSIWGVVTYILDGVIAIYLGLSLRGVIQSIDETEGVSFIYLVGIAIAVYFIVISIRFCWVMVQKHRFEIGPGHHLEGVKGALVYAFSSVHGTITLLIALSIPIMVNNEEFFMMRQELIIISSIIILVSIVVPTFVLPMLLHKNVEHHQKKETFEEYRRKMIEYAIYELGCMNPHENEEVASAIHILSNQLLFINNSPDKWLDTQKFEHLLEEAMHVQMAAIDELIEQDKISKRKAAFYKSYILHSSHKGFFNVYVNVRMWIIRHSIRSVFNRDRNKAYQIKLIQEFEYAQQYSCEAVLSYFKEKVAENEGTSEFWVMELYKKKLKKKESKEEQVKHEQVKQYLTKAFQIEAKFVRDARDCKLISAELNDQLLECIFYDEMIYSQSI